MFLRIEFSTIFKRSAFGGYAFPNKKKKKSLRENIQFYSFSGPLKNWEFHQLTLKHVIKVMILNLQA